MRNGIRAFAGTLVLVLLAGSGAQAKPTISEFKVPPDLPRDVREQVLKLYAVNSETRGYAAFDLGGMGERAAGAIPFLVAMLGDTDVLRAEELIRDRPLENEKEVFRIERLDRTSPGKLAAQALAKMGRNGLKLLMDALKDENPKVREHAALALGGIKDRSAVSDLIPVLKDKAWEVRAEAARALGRIADHRAFEALIAALSDDDWHPRREAVRALGQLKDPEAVEPLMNRLGDSVLVSDEVEKVLADFRGPRVVELAIPKLKDKNPEARKVAARILGRNGDWRAVPHLIATLKDIPEIQVEVLHALSAITGKQAEDFGTNVVKWQRWWDLEEARKPIQDIVAAGDVGGLIVKMRRDPSWAVRARAARALSQFEDGRAFGPLIEAMRQDADVGVRREAIWALGALRDPRAVEPLLETLRSDDPEIRREAEESLRSITRQQFALGNPKRWRQWWAANRDVWLEQATQERDREIAAQAESPKPGLRAGGPHQDAQPPPAPGAGATGSGSDTLLIVLGGIVLLLLAGFVLLRLTRRPGPRRRRRR